MFKQDLALSNEHNAIIPNQTIFNIYIVVGDRSRE